MRKSLYLIIIFCLCFLTSCNGSLNKNSNNSKNQSSSSSLQESTLELLFLTTGEVINVLGNNYSSPKLLEGNYAIEYPNMIIFCEILGEENYKVDTTKKIIGLRITKPDIIYKGISVGKTLEEINSHRDLLSHISPTKNMEGELGEVVRFNYRNSDIVMFLDFNENMVCTAVYIAITKNDEYYLTYTEI